MIKHHKSWLIPLILMLFITPFTPWLDLKVTHLFYTPDPYGIDHFKSGPFFDFLFNYGIFPAWILVGIAVIAALLSYFVDSFKKWQKPALVAILTLAIGAGFITHLVFKDHWGRPRPKQSIEFGGSQNFRPYYSPNLFHQPEPSKSFPCGHCSMGFFFFAIALIGRRIGNKALEYAGWILAFGLGGLLGIARIMQGAHFLSDVLMSALILWLTALFADWLVYQEKYLQD